jgi:uncharacterized protein YcnI
MRRATDISGPSASKPPGRTYVTRRRRCAPALAAVTSTALLMLTMSSPVAAHIDPDPREAQAGSRLSVGFTVEHGCAGSPTIQLDMRLPDGVSDAVPESPEGWSSGIDDAVVTFEGGPLPDDEELTFRVSLTLPPTPDTTIFFPFVQRCKDGEIRWIDLPEDGVADEPDEPAPAMRLVGPVVTTVPTTSTLPATTSPPSSDAPAGTAAPEPETSAPTTESTAGADADPEAEAPTATIVEAEAGADESGGIAAIAVIAVVGLAIAAVAAAMTLRRRR